MSSIMPTQRLKNFEKSLQDLISQYKATLNEGDVNERLAASAMLISSMQIYEEFLKNFPELVE